MVILEGVGKRSEPERYSILPIYTETYDLTGSRAQNSKLGLELYFTIQKGPTCFFLSSCLTHLHHYIFQQITTFFQLENNRNCSVKGKRSSKGLISAVKALRKMTTMEKWLPMVLHKVLKLPYLSSNSSHLNTV